MLYVCAKRVCVRFTKLVCKAMRLAFSCQTSVISFPFIPIPWVYLSNPSSSKLPYIFPTCSTIQCHNNYLERPQNIENAPVRKDLLWDIQKWEISRNKKKKENWTGKMKGNSPMISFTLLTFILLANGDTIGDGAGRRPPPIHFNLNRKYTMNMCLNA